MSSEPRMLDPNPLSPSAIPDGSKTVPLPTEIYESILDELAESPETLRACALVCHLFAQRAQKLLFSSICLTRPTKVFKRALGIRSYVWPSMWFLQIISSSPCLTGHVKSLIVSDTAHLQFYREELSWIRSDNTVHQILPRLTNLKELGLEGNFRGSGLNFRKWGDNLRVGILEQCSSERLVVIRLTCVRNVPLSLLGLAPGLETLVLKKVLFLPDFTAEEVFYLQRYAKLKERSPPARLKHLSVTMTISDEWRTIYPWLASHLDLTHIKILDLYIDFEGALEEKVEEGLQAISNLLRGCSATLETLRFLMPEQSGFPFHSVHKMNLSHSYTFLILQQPRTCQTNPGLSNWTYVQCQLSVPSISIPTSGTNVNTWLYLVPTQRHPLDNYPKQPSALCRPSFHKYSHLEPALEHPTEVQAPTLIVNSKPSSSGLPWLILRECPVLGWKI
jgi:hypothetical protein